MTRKTDRSSDVFPVSAELNELDSESNDEDATSSNKPTDDSDQSTGEDNFDRCVDETLREESGHKPSKSTEDRNGRRRYLFILGSY